MDQAKKMAQRAQEKLDDVQKQFNESQGAPGTGPMPPSGELAPTADKDDEYAPPKMSRGDPLAG